MNIKKNIIIYAVVLVICCAGALYMHNNRINNAPVHELAGKILQWDEVSSPTPCYFEFDEKGEGALKIDNTGLNKDDMYFKVTSVKRVDDVITVDMEDHSPILLKVGENGTYFDERDQLIETLDKVRPYTSVEELDNVSSNTSAEEIAEVEIAGKILQWDEVSSPTPCYFELDETGMGILKIDNSELKKDDMIFNISKVGFDGEIFTFEFTNHSPITLKVNEDGTFTDNNGNLVEIVTEVRK